MLLKITLITKNIISLKRCIKTFYNIKYFKFLQLNKNYIIYSKKQKRKFFTVLKSPHVNKTAQEQFELCFFSKDIKFKSFQLLKILIFLKKLQKISFSDISIKIKFVIKNFFKKDKIKKQFKLYKFSNVKEFLFFNQFYGKFGF